MSPFGKVYNYILLLKNLYNYYNYSLNNDDYDCILLDDLLISIEKCGAVMIKFCQWITPKLELIYLESNNIINSNKPKWLLKLEQFYEKCPEHSKEYTIEEYKKVFKEDISEKYELLEVIGSGSIGQVYLINEKKTNIKKVLKILHPDVRSQINFFKYFLNLVLFLPCIKKKIVEFAPFNIFEFINQFTEQTDLVNEGNNIIKARELSGKNGILYFRASTTGKVCAKTKEGEFQLNDALHENN